MLFFDTHCHFDFAPFDQDREAVWQSCLKLGMTGMVVPGVSPKQWQTVTKLCESHPGIWQAVGLHPWWNADFTSPEALAAQLREAVNSPNCVAIGEFGLDAAKGGPLDRQLDILAVHLQLAAEVDLPVIIHCHKAHNEMLRALKAHKLKRGGVIHAFSGSYEMAQRYWDMGFYLGIGGTITYERANKTRHAVQQLPLESLVLETDAPNMPLCGEQGQRNTPANILAIAQTLAELRGESLETVAKQTTLNAQALFFGGLARSHVSASPIHNQDSNDQPR